MAYTYQPLFQPRLYQVATGNQELIQSNDGMKHPAVEQLPRRQAMKDWLQSSVKRKAGEQSLKTNGLRSTGVHRVTGPYQNREFVRKAASSNPITGMRLTSGGRPSKTSEIENRSCHIGRAG